MPAGGARLGAGRKPGSVNKITSENRETLTALAQSHEQEAIDTLVALMRDPKVPPAARATCSNAILDRARGKAHLSIEHSGEVVQRFVAEMPMVSRTADDWAKKYIQ